MHTVLAKRPFSIYNFALIFLTLSPLIYSVDNDPYRGYEVIGIATVGVGVIILHRMRGVRLWPDVALVVLYGVVLIVQQLFIVNGSLRFGTQYAIHMALMFIPAWALIGSSLSAEKFKKTTIFTMNILGFITVLFIFSSYFLGIGEVYDGIVLRRAFSWFGDSYTPVIVFLIFYFGFQRKWLSVTVLFVAFIMTGGKTAMIMLTAAPAFYVLVAPLSIKRKSTILCSMLVMGLLLYVYWDLIFEAIFSSYEYSYNNREISMLLGIEYFKNNPWIGVGINQSMKQIDIESAFLISSLRINAYPVYKISNAFICAAAETGVFGTAVFLAICGVWLTRSLRILRHVCRWRISQERSLIMAGTLWVLCFIVTYQTTGWYEVGHPQLAWLLIISSAVEVCYRLAVRKQPLNVDANTSIHFYGLHFHRARGAM